MAVIADLAVMAAACVLLLAGSAKIVQPRPIASTVASLWNAVTGQARPPASPLAGRLLGAGEVALAAAAVLWRSRAAATALLLFAAGLSVAGLIGVLAGRELPCACFGKSERALGYPHMLQLPLWVVAAWSVTRDASLFGGASVTEQGLAMLASCAALVAAFQVVRLWSTVYPMARRRRLRARQTSLPVPGGAGASTW